MLYAIISTDVADSLEKRLARVPRILSACKHCKRKAVSFWLARHPAIDSKDPGPAGFTGSLVVAEFDSLVAAQAWADADPYVAAGVYANVIVKPFKKVLPNRGIFCRSPTRKASALAKSSKT